MKTGVLPIIISGLMLFVSCSDEQTKDQPVSPPKPRPISMSVAVSPRVIDFGGSATVLLSLTNDSTHEVSLDFECQDPFGYIIEAESGSFTLRSIQACVESPHTIVLAAGETRTFGMAMTATLAPMGYNVSAGMTEYLEEYPWVSTTFSVRRIGSSGE